MGRGSQQKSDSPLHVSLRATREQVREQRLLPLGRAGDLGDREPVGVRMDRRTGKKTPGGAGTHTGHTGHTRR